MVCKAIKREVHSREREQREMEREREREREQRTERANLGLLVTGGLVR